MTSLALAFLGLVAQPAHAASCTVDRIVSAADSCSFSGSGTASATSRRSEWCGTRREYGGEVVVQFTPPRGAAVRVVGGLAATVRGGSSSVDVDGFVTEGDCATSSACATKDVGSTDVVDLAFTASGSTYFAVLDENKGYVSWPWGLEISCGQDCPAARVTSTISCSTDVVAETTGLSSTLSFYACGTPYANLSQPNPEAIYAFTPQRTGPVTFRLTGLATDHDLYVLEDTCAAADCVASSTDLSTNADQVTFTATVGHTYYLVVEAFGGVGTYTLSFDAGPGGGCAEDCDNGRDDDGDGAIDCDDVDCAGDPACGTCDADGDGFFARSCGGHDCDDAVVHRGDGDGDGWPDACDACPVGSDADDLDADTVPDACDVCPGADDRVDGDRDTVPDGCDACPGGDDLADADADGTADGCDACPGHDDRVDGDRDTVPDGCDVCPGGDDRLDGDGDGIPNACDTCTGTADTDLDGVPNACDACPGHDDRLDADADGTADGCDLCPGADDRVDADRDTVPDGCDACPGSDDTRDADVDGTPDGCDVCPGHDDRVDADADGVPDACDPCPTLPGAPDADHDGDLACTDCDDADPDRSRLDVDHDGLSSCDGDCADHDASARPGAREVADGADDDCDGTVDEGTDAFDDDGDGFAEQGGDCDDADPDAHPGAAEVCDGLDQDCDGVDDEGTPCSDDDGDGACEVGPCTDGASPGDCDDSDPDRGPTATEVDGNGLDDDCDGIVDANAPDADGDGVTGAGGDCDPDDGEVHPGAPERLNGVDDDCDGVIDEETSGYDDDGDGVSEDEADCDDTDPTVHPGATETADGVDEDCDGVVDDGTATADDDDDGTSEEGGDCDDADPAVHAGAPEVANGVDDDCDGAIDEGTDDLDGDGVSVAQGDCDDADGWTFPHAWESCDDVDNDCDGAIDDGCDVAATDPGGACGCASTGPGPIAPVVLVGLLALRRRRAAWLAVPLAAGCSGDTMVSDIRARLELRPPIRDLGVFPVGAEVREGLDVLVLDGSGVNIEEVTLRPLVGEGFTYTGVDGFRIDAGAPFGFPIRFLPTEPGYASALLQITSDARGSPHTIEVRARALLPDFSVVPPVLDLGVVPAGVDGVGAISLVEGALVPVEVTGVLTAAGELAFGDVFPLVVQGGGSAPLAVTYRADHAGPFEATVRFASTSGELPAALVVRANDCVHGDPQAYDRDGDGVTSCGGDCDDADDDVRSGRPERPNGIDDDCDGAIDEGTALSDDDGDGACEGPEACTDGAVPGDCRDDAAAIGPDVDEVNGNGVDDDCDGVVDVGVADADRDGVAVPLDCDDHDAGVRPGAPERANGVDDDCDGTIDEGTVRADDDGDGYCEAAAGCEGTATPGDCDDTDRTVHPGATERPDRADDDCDGRVDEGTSLSDDDGDGYTEAGGDCDDRDPARSPGLGTCP